MPRSPEPPAAGHSGTPLAAKLGYQPGARAWLAAMPASVRATIDPERIGIDEVPAPVAGLDLAHLFVPERAELDRLLGLLRPLMTPAGMIWVSWPKRAAKVPTDITEDVIRALALPIGLVDIKVCAVDATWSGLKLVIRKALRGG